MNQDQNLPTINNVGEKLEPALHKTVRPAPSDADNVAALRQAAKTLGDMSDQQAGAGADAARRLAAALDNLAQADASRREAAAAAFIHPLQIDLDDVGDSLNAEHVTRKLLPADLVRDWVTPDGKMRIEVWPKGDANDNAIVRRFARAVQAAQPDATGERSAAPNGVERSFKLSRRRRRWHCFPLPRCCGSCCGG